MKTKLILTLVIAILAIPGYSQCPSTLTVTVNSITGASCPDAGAVTLGGNGVGNSNVFFTITSGPSHVGQTQLGATFGSLTAGTYTFRASCGSNTDYVTATVPNLYTNMDPTFQVTVNDVCTNFKAGGTITVGSITGGTAPIQYSFIENSEANYSDALSNYTSSNTFTSNRWGTFQVRIKDACGVFLTRTIELKASQPPAKFGGASIEFNTYNCDSATLYFWLISPDGVGLLLEDYGHLKFNIFEKSNGCTPGALIKSFSLYGGADYSIVIPRRSVLVQIISPCGDTTNTCYDYPTDDSLQSFWDPILTGCGTSGNPFALSIRHLNNIYCTEPFTVRLDDLTTSTTLFTKPYSRNWNCDTYTNLPLHDYRLIVTDACGKKDTVHISPPTGPPAILSTNFGTEVSAECTFQNGKVSAKLKLTGQIPNIDTDTLTITSGPDNIGQSVTRSMDGRYFFTNLTAGATYGFSIKTPCSVINLSFTLPDDNWRLSSFSIKPTVIQQCGGSGTITINGINAWGVTTTELWRNNVKIDSNAGGTYANLPSGLYEVRAIYTQSWCNGQKSTTLSDTVRIYPDGTAPVLARQFAYVCNSGTDANTKGSVIIDVQGFGPFTYLIKQVSPILENDYTLIASNAPGQYSIPNLDANATYDLLIIDNCGKSTVSQINVGQIATLQFQNFYQPCVGSPYLMQAPEIPGAVYSWTKNGSPTQLSNTRELYFSNFLSAYDGTYTCTVTLDNSCFYQNITETLNSATGCSVLAMKPDQWRVVGDGCDALLEWKGATAKSGIYIVEYSTDASNFKPVAQVIYSGSENKYQHRYSQLREGLNYFRLKFTDNSGRFSYSDMIKFTKSKSCGGFLSGVSVSPNPVISQMNLNWKNDIAGKLTIEILNPVGSVVVKQSAVVIAGNTIINLDASALVPAMYYLRITTETGKSQILKFIKQ